MIVKIRPQLHLWKRPHPQQWVHLLKRSIQHHWKRPVQHPWPWNRRLNCYWLGALLETHIPTLGPLQAPVHYEGADVKHSNTHHTHSLVIIQDGVQSVGNGEHSARGKLRADGLLNEVIGLHVHCCCCLVQYKDLGLPQQSTCQTHQLTLPDTAPTSQHKPAIPKTNSHHGYLRFSPPSDTGYASPSAKVDTKSLRCAISSTLHRSSSE